jgi:hypothetical protein
MNLSLLTPEAALVGAVVVVALAALAVSEARSRRACALLGLAPRSRRSLAVDALALASVGGLLALAAAQPVVSSVGKTQGRADAEMIAVMDITRSMLARSGPAGTTRLDRARSLAKEIRAGVPTVAVGVASLTDRVLPHLFPSLSQNSFAATVDRAIGIERPPPDRRTRTRATALNALSDVPRLNFFGNSSTRRVMLVLTDGESLGVDLGTLRARLYGGHTALVVVHVWGDDERVYTPGGSVEPYRPDPSSSAAMAELATAVDGFAFTEEQPDAALDRIRRLLGDGPIAARGEELTGTQLAPLAAGAALVPLLILLRRRNL